LFPRKQKESVYRDRIFKCNSVYTFYQHSFILFILMLLSPQGEVVETCQIWGEESTYKSLWWA